MFPTLIVRRYVSFTKLAYFINIKKILTKPTLSHDNSYIFHEVANSYELEQPHSYDFVRFV